MKWSLCPLSKRSHTFPNPPTFCTPTISTATRPPSITMAWNTSFHITALIPPLEKEKKRKETLTPVKQNTKRNWLIDVDGNERTVFTRWFKTLPEITLQVISDWISHFPLSSLAENNNISSEHQVKSFEHLLWKPICKEI